MATNFQLKIMKFWFGADFNGNQLFLGVKVSKLTQLDCRTRLPMACGSLEQKKNVAPRDLLNAGKTKFLHVAR